MPIHPYWINLNKFEYESMPYLNKFENLSSRVCQYISDRWAGDTVDPRVTAGTDRWHETSGCVHACAGMHACTWPASSPCMLHALGAPASS